MYRRRLPGRGEFAYLVSFWLLSVLFLSRCCCYYLIIFFPKALLVPRGWAELDPPSQESPIFKGGKAEAENRVLQPRCLAGTSCSMHCLWALSAVEQGGQPLSQVHQLVFINTLVLRNVSETTTSSKHNLIQGIVWIRSIEATVIAPTNKQHAYDQRYRKTRSLTIRTRKSMSININL